MDDIGQFITKNIEIVKKILEIEGFNKEKLEKILEITSNNNFHFDFVGGCPDNFWLATTLEKRMNTHDYNEQFTNFLKEKNFYEEGYKIISGGDWQNYDYKVVVDQGKPSELQILFSNPKQ
jgi:hypothetical protein